MNTLNDTAQSTLEHGQADCRCPDDRCAGYHHEVGETCHCTRTLDAEVEQLIASVEVIDGGEMKLPWRSIPWGDGKAVIDNFAVLSEDCSEVTIYRTPDLKIAGLTYGASSPRTDDLNDWIVRNTIERHVYGTLGKDRTFFHVGGMEGVFAEVNELITHPSWCEDRERCVVKEVVDSVEHSATDADVRGEEFTATASFGTVHDRADHADLRHGEPGCFPEVTLGGPEQPEYSLFLWPRDLRKLGQFLVDEAHRFESMMQEVGVEA